MATINGIAEDVKGKTILNYLLEAGYNTESVVVEKNLDIIPRAKWEEELIEDEDTIEILRFVGGG